MEIRCRCTGCSAKFKVDAKYAGKKARCPKCQVIVEVPLSGGEETVTVPTVVGPAPSSLAPTVLASAVPAPTTSATSKLSKPKQVPTTVAIPVPKSSPLETAPPPQSTPSQEPSQAASPPSPAPTVESSFPTFATVTPSKSTTPVAGDQAHPSRGRKKANLLPLYIGGTLTAIVAAVAIVILIASSSGSKQTASKKGNAGTASAAKDATLLLDWPPAERSGGAVVIDGQRRAIAAAGTLKFTLAPGKHKVVALRRGFEPFDTTFDVALGKTITISPVWKASNPVDPAPVNGSPLPPNPTIFVAGFDGWLQNFKTAKRKAAAENKDLLIVFGCSDNDQETQNLARNLAQAEVLQSHVCVVVDFPDTTRGLDVVADLVANNSLAQQFGVSGVPSLALADEQGRAFFLKRDWSDGYGAMPTKIAEWSKLKAERDELLVGAGQGSDQEKLSAAAKAVRWLQDKGVWRLHSSEIRTWLADAQKIDADNQNGLLEVFFEPQWVLGVADIRGDDLARVDEVIGQLDPWIARKFQDPDRGAKLHLVAAYVLFQLERFDEAAIQVDHASKYKPKDATLTTAIDIMKRDLATSNLLGTGTGFLISSDGHVLTNHHVIEGDGRIEVRLHNRTETLAATVVKWDEERDIALLKITLPEGGDYKPLPLSVGELELNESVAAYGHPLGDQLGERVKSSRGSINGLPEPGNGNMLLLDVTINPGNSGGPLCDTRANVVGMVTAKFKGGATEDSIGLAIPAEDLERFLVENLPAGTVRPAPSKESAELVWTKVSTQVKSGVLMILNKKK